MRKIIVLVNFFILFLSAVCLANLQSTDAKVIEKLLRENLALANEGKKLRLVIADDNLGTPVSAAVNEIATANLEGRLTNKKFIKLYISTPSDEKIGWAILSIGNGMHPTLQLENDNLGTQNFSKDKYFVDVTQIAIDEKQQGQGFASIALDIFLDFIDRIGSNYSFLKVESDKPFTANMYYKRGYRFTNNTLQAIKDTKGIGTETAYLQDSTKALKFKKDHWVLQNPYMVRLNAKNN